MKEFWFITFVYFNGTRSYFEIRVTKNTSLIDLKSKLEKFLHHIDNRIVAKIEYRSPKVDNEGKINFNNLELKTDANVSVMWITFHSYVTKSSIEVSVIIARSTTNILKMMTHIEPSVMCIDNKDLCSVISFYILHLILLMCYMFVKTWVNMNFNIRTNT